MSQSFDSVYMSQIFGYREEASRVWYEIRSPCHVLDIQCHHMNPGLVTVQIVTTWALGRIKYLLKAHQVFEVVGNHEEF